MSAPPLLSPLCRSALFLDFDGTLAPITDTPGGVAVDPALNNLLLRLKAALKGRLAIVSGRPVAEIDRLTDSAAICVAGVHGLERRTNSGALTLSPADPAIEHVREALQVFSDAWPGLLIEPKGSSVAVHYRQAQQAKEAVFELVERLAASTGLQIQPGQMVVELRSPGPDKGDAVRAFMAEQPFAGAVAVFIGDDLTDEPAFEAVNALGGLSIQVGKEHRTAADYRLPDQSAVADWLKQVLQRDAFSPLGLDPKTAW